MNPFTPHQVEFLAEDEDITIIPNFKMAKLDFPGGVYGPFQPSVPATVPLWLASMLKQQKKCRIQPPTWLSVSNLNEKLREEREVFTTQLGNLPYYYMVISKILLDCAEDDIPRSTEVHSILSSLWEVRSEKLRKSMLTITSCPDAASCANMSSLEINTIKPLFCKSLDKLYELRSAPQAQNSAPTQDITQPKLRSLRGKRK